MVFREEVPDILGRESRHWTKFKGYNQHRIPVVQQGLQPGIPSLGIVR
jgi:hypothetical protein